MKPSKFVIVLFTFSIFIGNKSYSQNYIPMINDSMYWDIAYKVNDPNPCAMFGAPYRYAFNGDTTINGTVYSKMIGYEFHSFSPSGCPPFYIDTIPQYFDIFLREDTIAQEVYRYNTNSQSEILLFDFSLQQGDSIFIPSFISPNFYFYVDTLYTIITADGISRKYFECFPRPNQGTTGGFYIEGIGGAMGPSEEPYHYFEQGYWILCVSDLNQSTIYGYTFNCYNFTTGISQNDESLNTLNIYPNPATESINVVDLPPNTSITITNVLGEIMLRRQKLQETTLDISNLSAGLYYIILESDSTRSYARFIKQ